MVYVQSSTQEGCFLVHLLQEEGFSLLTENLIMRGGAESRFGDITTSTEAIPGPARELTVDCQGHIVCSS